MIITDKAFFDLILIERQAQIAKWGDQEHVDSKWLAIGVEEIGEIAKVLIECKTDAELLSEIVQLAAVLQAWVTSKDWFYDDPDQWDSKEENVD